MQGEEGDWLGEEGGAKLSRKEEVLAAGAGEGEKGERVEEGGEVEEDSVGQVEANLDDWLLLLSSPASPGQLRDSLNRRGARTCSC